MLNNWFLDTRRTLIASYSPLRMHDLEYQPEDSGEEAILLPSKDFNSEPHKVDPASKWSTRATLGLSVLVVARACASIQV
ncbi:hypothetical protein AZE42_11592 [Rhizopogon vesiculosus]|uniref:Uncharacterized protein n=1 Tax=Rhizopogon vesiculosus TaxID=180088 RepID=A0A1J8QEP2_9AGAM|nr:hypothetical protein AZE42_11592 [Rhizopogon vesiculosus]